MAFVNTREVLGERATLDCIIDGTLEELKDDCSVTIPGGTNSTVIILPHDVGLKVFVVPNLVATSGVDVFSKDDSRYAPSSGAVPGVETVVIQGKGNPQLGELFDSCLNLKTVDMLFNGSIGTYVFTRCTSLKTIIIRDSWQINLIQPSSFTNTPFASGGSGGTLYVKQSLISSYQNASNWSTLLSYENNQILPIEGSIYDGYYADGTPIE